MADEIDDAEAAMDGYKAAPFANIPGGLVIRQLARELRAIKDAVRDLKARVDRLDPGGR